MKTTFTFIFCILLLTSFSATAQNEGNAAPDFTLDQLGGGQFKLSEQSGKVVFIFWLGYDCPLCKSASPSVKEQIVDAFSSNNNFVAIGVDTWDGSSSGVNAFKSSTGLDINYLLMGSDVAKTYSTTYDRLAVIDKNGVLVHKGTTNASSDLSATKSAITNALQVVTSAPSVNENLSGFSSYPNPFSNQTIIRFQLDKPGLVNLDVFDISGKKVSEIVNRQYPSGDHRIGFSKAGLDSGIYLLRLINNGYVSTQKMVIR